MSLFPEVVLASSNKGKIKEFEQFFEPYNTKIIPQSELGIEPCDEPYPTFLENAIHKARHASRLSGKPAIADDSGICATALYGAPGVHSHRFAGPDASDEENNKKLVEMLKNEKNKQAWYACALVLMPHPKDPHPVVAEGRWEGQIIDSPRGENGFGYDPYFYVPEYRQTAAEMAPSLKNRISHRGVALISLMQQMDELMLRAGLRIPQTTHYMSYFQDRELDIPENTKNTYNDFHG